MNQLFYFTKKERRATILLAAVILISLSIQTLIPDTDRSLQYDLSGLRAKVDSTRAMDSDLKGEIVIVKPFDINEITSRELQDLGLPVFVADRWVKYREAREGFQSVDNVSSIYGLDDSWFQTHREYMTVEKRKVQKRGFGRAVPTSRMVRGESNVGKEPPRQVENDTTAKANDEHSSTSDREPAIPRKVDVEVSHDRQEGIPEIDINSANEWQWQMLHGIGPFYAKRIVNFRDKLGGFYSIEQVGHTYGLPDSTFQNIKAYLKISTPVSRFNINKISADSLSKHPYISRKQANILFRYRLQHGNYSSVNDFYDVKVFDTAFVKMIEPYISF